MVFANPQGKQTSRVPLKVGAEIFGAAGVSADAEVIGLMLEALEAAGMHTPVLLLGHMGIYRGLVARLIEEGGIDEANQSQLFSCIQRKGASDIRALLDESDVAEMVAALPDLMGDMGILPVARDLLQRAPQSVLVALDELQALAELIDLRIDV